ncbi:MAG: hypothetical protein DRN17_01985 [Thermoplasmata archaeon]|nr:MAG: hypothetical protein DRN17_01985 [Thermoplasmata archaeon]
MERQDNHELEECLEDVREIMEKEPPLVEFNGKVMIAGDTHGDLKVTKAIAERFFEREFDYLVFLGDYIDRAPPDIGSSVPNINYLLFLKRDFPENIILLKGNHEANYAIPCYPYEFEKEVEKVYPGMHEKYVEVFKNMPLMVLSNKIFASHGGILKGFGLKKLREADKNDLHAIESLTWSDPDFSQIFRGIGIPYGRKDLEEFLDGIGASVLIKGHDYSTNGMAIYGGLCLTIFSSRRYKNTGKGGILIAEIESEAKSIKDIKVMDYSTGRWRDYTAEIV